MVLSGALASVCSYYLLSRPGNLKVEDWIGKNMSGIPMLLLIREINKNDYLKSKGYSLEVVIH